ncbi:DUF5047 domain-containing protein [Jiangella asiatica]|uniref:DUF5047 domain-containing protein n=1 Tax=Jiangella asiatica TaxID=2530372 RepID=A0A4R5CKJ6_9ACTN|nr:DUF5047 domain-containing protein [Jiangella asiatica]TDD98893.1 DUF5047 domain-containing protein [Jiangella asiatica]
MRPVSQQFLDAVRDSHKMRAEVIAVPGHQTGVNPTGTQIKILGGNVVSDGTADVRASLDLTTEPALWPNDHTDVLAPYGQELFVRRGIEFGDRHVEWVSLGYFRVESPAQDAAPLGEVEVTAKDRMAAIVDGRLVAPVQFALGTTLQEAFEQLILDVYPSAVIDADFDMTSVVFNRNMVAEEDRYAFLRDLADAMAKDFYVDYRGIFVVKDRPDPAEPVFEVNAGRNGVLVEMSRELTREGVYNGVVATGEGADQTVPVRALAVDDDPASPTYWHGVNQYGLTFGKVPRFYSSQFLTTTQQAQAAAAKMLRDNLGLPFSLDLAAVPNPALEPFDPVRVLTRDHDYIHTLQTVTIPLTAGEPLTATTKDQTSIEIGLS